MSSLATISAENKQDVDESGQISNLLQLEAALHQIDQLFDTEGP